VSRGRLLCQKLAQISLLLVFAVTISPTWIRAQTPREADQDLNASYKAAMQGLAPAAREKLKIAQRAWLAFVEKNSAAMRAAARGLGVSSKRCEELEVKEVGNRAMDFNYSEASKATEGIKGHFQRVDADLNAVYERCLATLSPEGKEALREAQRTWVAYRDTNRPFGLEFLSGLTVRRADQLSDFYIESTTAPLNPSRPKAEASPPNPFERAK